ncbi:MAG: ANTAR domain-containing protein [Ruminococcus sp.]|nr:ANTAR domain-containing protein [Ruminococcus sp.]MCM1381298.1 ANTAR domain-containing protein [Muribaculaceae bacterium]MCM1479307.1 ANTAR domain-containing protein [Muribaculaceae bacterium]
MPNGKNIIIFSEQGETLDNITMAAGEFGFGEISVSDSAADKTVLAGKNFGTVFINAPVGGVYGLDVAAAACGNGSGVILAAPAKHCAEIARKIGGMNLFILPRPLNKTVLLQTFRYVTLTAEHAAELSAEKAKLEQKLKDVRLVDRAKCVLVEVLKMSEADAHRHIQKQAMDRHVQQIVIARDILKTYEM